MLIYIHTHNTLLFIEHLIALIAQAMELPNELNKKKRKQNLLKNRVSFSATLPDDVRGIYSDSICAVKYSSDPFSDIRESILEMIQTVGVRDWKELEELVYCYIVLNPSEVHEFIEEAFLSVCCSLNQMD